MMANQSTPEPETYCSECGRPEDYCEGWFFCMECNTETYFSETK